MSDAFTLSDYEQLLRQWLGFQCAWEPLAERWIESANPTYWSGRQKCAWLKADLNSLGAADRATPMSADALQVESYDDALGVLYVTEGATLGGQYIVKRLAGRLGIPPEQGLRFFSSYGPDTAARWTDTKFLLDGAAVDGDRTIRSACNTFNVLAAWLPQRSCSA